MKLYLLPVLAAALALAGCASQRSYSPISRSQAGGLRWDVDRTHDGGVMVSSWGRYQPRGLAAYDRRAAATGCLNGNYPRRVYVTRNRKAYTGAYVIAIYNCG